jgi:hypothetical protein
MPSHKDKLLAGEPYLADDPELPEDRHRCRLLTEQLNATSVGEPFAREEILGACWARSATPPRSCPRFSVTTAT